MDTILYYQIRDNIFYYGANQWEGSTALTNTSNLPISCDGVLKILPQDDSIVEWYLDELPYTGENVHGSPSLVARETDWSHIRLHNYIHTAFYHDSYYSDYQHALTLYNSVNFNKSKQWLNSEFIINDNLDTGTTYNRKGMLSFCSGNIDVSFPGLVDGTYLFAGYSSNLVLTEVNLDLPNAMKVEGRDSANTTWNLNIPSANTLSGFDNGDIVLNNSVKIHPANCLRNVKSLTGKGNISFIEGDGDYSSAFSNYKGTFDNINIDYNNVVDATSMYNATNITDIYFDAPKCINLNSAFRDCTLLTTVKLNTPKVTSMDYTFYGDTGLTTINSSNLSKLTSGNYTFGECTSLVGGNGTSYNSSNISYTYAKVDREGNPGYFTYIKSDTYYNVEVINSDYATISYPGANFARGDTVEITAKLPSYLGVDYWLQYNTGDNSWHNIGSKDTVSGEIQSDMKFILVPKYLWKGLDFKVSLISVPSNSCTLTGAGTYRVGDDVVITASANEGYVFKQWEELINETWVLLSYDKEYTLKAIGRDRIIRAVCVEDTSDEVVEVTLLIDAETGSVEGAGKYVKGTKATIKAVPGLRYRFLSWKLAETSLTISMSNPYTFTVNKSISIRAVMADKPYWGDNSSGTGGGDGNFDKTSDKVGGAGDEYSNVFTYDGGLFTAFVLSDDDVGAFKGYMYTTDLMNGMKSVIDKIGSLGGEVSDYILNFMKLPITIPVTQRKDVQIGFYPTNLNFAYADKIGYQKGMGSLKVEPYWGNALDYKSKIQIYLPYIGYEYLDTAEVMGKTIGIKYNISLIDGSCVALIYVDDNLKYQFNGNCATNLPISQVNMTEVTQKALSLGTSVITAGATADSTIGTLQQAQVEASQGTIAGQSRANSLVSKSESDVNKASNGIQNAISNIGGNVRRCSNLSGNLGFLSSQTPYLIISRPRLCMPDNYAHYHGYPSNITRKLGELSGYTVVSNIHLDGLDATSSEIEELESILKAGVIIR